jgi:hypothetical protein
MIDATTDCAIQIIGFHTDRVVQRENIRAVIFKQSNLKPKRKSSTPKPRDKAPKNSWT